MAKTAKYEVVFLINAVLLTCHEIDSAYWHEWNLFHLPGGIQLFVLLHLLLLPVVFYGYREVCIDGPRSTLFSLILGGTGIFAAVVHGTFIAAGDHSFLLPVSSALLIAILVTSLLQLYFVIHSEN